MALHSDSGHLFPTSIIPGLDPRKQNEAIFFLQQAADKNSKKGFKNGASQQMFGPSYFVRALG